MKHFIRYWLTTILIIILVACGSAVPTEELPPSAPTNVTATPGLGHITVFWMHDGQNVTGFEVYRETVAADSVTVLVFEYLAELPADARNYRDESVAEGNAYRYAVAAQGPGGASARALQVGEAVTPEWSAACVDPVSIPDSGLAGAIRRSLNKPTGDIACIDMENLVSLNADGLAIHDLEGLQFAVNLTRLNLKDNNISDVSALAGLTGLEQLYLDDNSISNIRPLTRLINLQKLYFGSNSVTNITPLAGLTSLQELGFWSNSVSDITPLASLTNLQWLYFYDNSVSDITPLAGLSNLQELYFYGNSVSNISPLVGLANLRELGFWSNSVSDITPLAGLSNLQELYFESNSVSDISPLAGLTNLRWLYFGSNSVSDISSLASLANLRGLSLYDNSVNDISALVNNSGLRAGDSIDIINNCLDLTLGSEDFINITTLINRGVTVKYTPQQTCF